MRFDRQQLGRWLAVLADRRTHTARHYDLTVAVRPVDGSLEIEGRVSLDPVPEAKAGAGAVAAARAQGAEPVRGPGAEPARVRLLLNPDLEFVPLGGLRPAGPQPPSPASPEPPSPAHAEPRSVAASAPLREVLLPPGRDTLAFRCRGRLPREWASPRSTELCLYNLWYPLFSTPGPPFSFRVLLKVPPMSVPAMNGRLEPLPPELRPREHDDVSPRCFLWVSEPATTDITACVGPYAVHEAGPVAPAREASPPAASAWSGLIIQVYARAEHYDLAEAVLGWAERLPPALNPWLPPGPPSSSASPSPSPSSAEPPPCLRLVLPPVSNWGVYAHPGYIVIPAPLAAGRDPAGGGLDDLLADLRAE